MKPLILLLAATLLSCSHPKPKPEAHTFSGQLTVTKTLPFAWTNTMGSTPIGIITCDDHGIVTVHMGAPILKDSDQRITEVRVVEDTNHTIILTKESKVVGRWLVRD